MSWLGLPEMHAAIETELKTACGIAIHESQSFLYEQRLGVDKDYLMTAEIEHQDNPKRLVLRICIEKQTHEPVLRMETILRIVSAAESVP
jgi:Zn-dependent M32 family carboxypeptidase